MARNSEEAMEWFLYNSSGSLKCVRDDGEEMECDTFIKADEFFSEKEIRSSCKLCGETDVLLYYFGSPPVRVCGECLKKSIHSECGFSTGITGELTAGRGRLDDLGFWEFPCDECVEAMEKLMK